MRMNRLGSTGLIVSELCLGTLTFGASAGPLEKVGGLDLAASTALLREALDAGINFIDTANAYADGQSEALLGQALRDLGVARSSIVLGTKAVAPAGPGVNDVGASRRHLLDQIDVSLGRLGVDYVDLYQLHAWDPLTPIDETLRALDDIVRSGRARYVGVSNWAAWQITKALGLSDRLGLERFATVQAYYTVAGRDIEREIVPMLRSERLGLLVYSPLAGGLLSGKYDRGSDDGSQGEGRRASFDFPPVVPDRAYAIIDAMRGMAQARGVSVARIAIAWLLYQPSVSSVIVGATRSSQLADNIAACDVVLTADDLAVLDRLSALPPEYPGWMFEMQDAYRASAVSPRRIAG